MPEEYQAPSRPNQSASEYRAARAAKQEAQAAEPQKPISQREADWQAGQGSFNLGPGVTTHHTDAYNDSFAGYDINFNADDWEGQRAKNQSGWEQAGSAITQLVVGEVLGGTIENIGSLFNIQDWGGIAEGESQNTANFLQEIGRGLKEGTQENFAIYEEEPGSFNMSDSGWWFKNGVSMGSTLSMMLPAMGVMKGISMAGKALGGAKLLAKMGALGVELGIEGSLANTVVKGVGQAIVSRQLENTMEAQGVYDEQVKFFMSKGYTRDEAKKGAGIAAADVYKKNWAMLAMDIPQYMLLGSKFNPASLSIDTALSKAIGKSATASIAKGVRHTVVDLAGEGVEESFQYIVGEEAKYLSNRAMGIDHIIPETKLSERMEEYSKSGEMWSSAFWGAAGGGVFAAIGPMVQKGTDQQIARDAINTANRAKDINTFASRAAMWGKRVRQADISGNPAVMEQVRIEMNADMTIARAQLGNIDKHIEQLKAQASMTEKEIEEFNSANEGKEITNDFRELIPKLIADAENIKEMYGKNARKYSQALVPAITTAEFNRERYTKQAEETRLEAKQEEAKIPGLSKLSDRGAILWESKLDLAANEHFIAMTEDLMNSEGLTKQARKSMAKAIAAAKEDIAINLEDIAAASEMEYTGTKKEIANRKRYDRNKLKAIGTADSTFKLIAKAALLEAQVEAAQEEYAFFTDKDFNEKNKNLHHKVAIENAENLEVLNDIKKKAGEAVDQEVKDAIEKKSKELAKQDKEEEDNEKEEDNKASLKKAENTIVEEEGKAARIKAENAKLKRMMLGEEVEEEELDVLKDLEVEEPKGPVNPEDVPGSKAAIKKAQVEKEAKEKSSKAAAIPVEVIEEREKDPVKDAVKTSKSVAKSGEVLVEDVTGITGKLGSKEDKTPSNTKGDNAYMNLAYNSTYKTGSSRRDKALSKFLENPETKLDGYSVEYKIGTEYLKLKQKFELFDDFTKGNQITDLIQQEMAQIPVEAHIIDSDGNPAKEDEVSLYMTVFDKSSDSKERANLLSIRQDLVAAHFEGTKLTSPITNKGDGAPRVDNTGTEHSLTTVLGEGEVVFMVPTRGLDNNMDKGFYSAGTGDNVPDISSVSMREGTKGFGFAVAKTAGARDYPFKMNAPKITPDNAEIAYNILKALMSSDKSITPTALIENETIAGFHNITYGNALNLIVFNGTKTAESGQFPIYIMEGNILKMGENIFIKPNEIGGEVAKAQVIEYLKGITTPIEHSRINKPLLEGTGKERAKLFGKEYTNTDSYNRFMIDTRRVTTNTKVDENGHSFHTPSITVGSPTVSGTPKVIKPAQTSFDTLGSPSQSEQLQMDLEQELAIAEERLNLTEIESPELFAINNAAGITPESFKEQNMSVGIKADVALGWVRTAKSGGITLDQAAHKLFEQANDRGIHEGVTESDFKDMLLDAVKGTKVLEREKITGSKKDITELRKELADVKAKNEASSYTAPKVTKVAKPTSFNKKYATSKKAAEKNGTEFKLITMDDIKLKESSLDGFDEQEGVVSVVLLEERTDGVTRSGTVKIQTVDGDISKYEVTLKSEPNSVEAQIDKIERRRKDFLDKYNRGEATNEIIEVDNYEWKKGKLYNVRLEISGYYGKGTFFEGVESEEAGYGLPRLYIKNTNELIDDSYTGNIERLINAKYDTEIAALEGKPAIAVAEPAKLSFKEKLAIAQAKKIEENNDVNESNFRRFDNSPGLDKGGVEFLEKNFPHIPVRLKERLLRIKGSSNKAYGAYKNGIITLSKVAAQGTAYHEAFHVVADLHMTPSEKKAIFKEAERKYGTMSSKKLEEELAEAARRYISSGGKTKHSGVMAQFFADLWNLIKDVFTNERRANKVFQGMMDGKYANAPVSARVSDMSNETMYREISAFSAATTKAFVNTLTFEIAHQTGALDAENLDLITKNDITEESIKGFLNGYVNETLEAAENAQTEEEGEALMALYEKYQEALNHTELFRDGVIDNFKSYGLKTTSNKKETIEDDESTEETVEDVEQGDGGLGIKPAFESSGKDNASGNTKMMLSMLPKLKSTKVTTNSNGKVIKDYIVDELTGRPMLASFDATWASTASKLADIVDTHNGATGVTELAFDKMMDALAELALTRPEISIIHKRLTSPETPINSKAQFFNAFSKHHIEFLTTRATKDEETGSWTSKTGTSATRTHASSILREWGALFNDKFLLEDGTTYNKEAIDGAISNYKTFQAVLVNDLRKDINVVKNQERFRKMLHSIGVNISESGLNTYILSQKGEALGDKLWSAYTSLDHAFSTGMAKATEVNNIKHILESEERFKDLSKAESLYLDDTSETTVLGADDNMYYVYSLNNFLTKKMSDMRTREGFLNKISDSVYNTNSKWKVKKVAENIQFHVFNNLRQENANDTGSKYTDLKLQEEITTRMNQTLGEMTVGKNGKKLNLKSYFSTLTSADKSVWYLISGPKMVQANTKSINGQYVVDDAVIDRFGAYFLDELGRMQEVWNELYGPNPIKEHQKIQNYHTGNMNGLKSALFPSLNPYVETESEDGAVSMLQDPESPTVASGLYLDSKNGKPTFGKDTPKEIRSIVEAAISDMIDTDINKALSSNVIKISKAANGDLSLKNNTISKDILKGYATEVGPKGRKDALIKALGDYTVNAMIANIESTKLFTGDPAFYKNMDDFKKRIPATIAPGQDLFLMRDKDGNVKRNFNIAVVNDIEGTNEPTPGKTSQEMYTEYFRDFNDKKREALKEAKKTNPKAKDPTILSNAAIDKLLEPYAAINLADAQAYITLDRAMDLRRMLGQAGPSVEAAYERLKDADAVLNPEDVSVFFQPMKGMYFDLIQSDTSNAMVPTYLKYSQAVLIPAVVKGTKLENVLATMERDNVQELVFNSGIKVGAKGQVDGNALEAGTATLNPITLDNSNWKLQQDLPSKYDKKGYALEGSQVKKHIIANLLDDSMYGEMTGAELRQAIHDVERNLSDMGKDNFFDELGVTINEDGSLNTNKIPEYVYDLLADELGSEVSVNVKYALSKKMPLDSIPGIRKQVQQKLLAMLNKATVKLTMPGGALVQMSAYGMTGDGLSASTDSHVKWFNDGKKLLPPRIENGVVKGGQILVPHNAVKHIEGYESMSGTELKEILGEAGLLDAIGYRIPTQDLSSVDKLEIAGVLPSYYGDTMIVYPEIVAKTGSDFDIDKMFIMQPNTEIRNGKLQKLSPNGTTKEALQNKKLELYDQVLSTEEAFMRNITPLDADWLKEQAKEIRNLRDGGKKDMVDMQFFSATEQTETKVKFTGGKFGVGQTANQQGNHIIGQAAKIAVNRWHGFGHHKSVDVIDNVGELVSDVSSTDLSQIYATDGTSITANISAYLNAYVDIAKDAYIFDLNNNTQTANTVFFMLRAGAPAKFVNYFIAQKSLIDLVQATNNTEGIYATNESFPKGHEKEGELMNPMESTLIKWAGGDGESSHSLTQEFLEKEMRSPTKDGQRFILNNYARIEESARKLSDAVLASKDDTNGAGQTLMDAMINENHKDRIGTGEGPKIVNFDKIHEGTMIESHYKNSAQLAPVLFGNLFLANTPGFKSAMNEISKQILGSDKITNKELATKIENQAYSYLASTSDMMNHPDVSSMFYGDNSMAHRLKEFKYGKESKISRNPLIDMLKIGSMGTKDEPSFIGTSASRKKGLPSQDAIIEGWGELLDGDNGAEAKAFAEELVQYAFYSSGFQQGGSTFYDLIPAWYLEEQGFSAHIERALSTGEPLYNFTDQFLRHNSSDLSVIKEAKGDVVSAVKGFSTKIAFQIKGDAFNIGYDRDGEIVHPEYMTNEGGFFKLKGYETRTVKGKDVKYALYGSTHKLGYKSDSGRIIEYTDKAITESEILGNGSVGIKQLQDNRIDLGAMGDEFNMGIKYGEEGYINPTTLPETDPNYVPFQKKAMGVVEHDSVTNKKLALLNESIPAFVKYDSDMVQVGKVEAQADGSPLVTLNPLKIADDTVIHEYGHIYIDMLGGQKNEFVSLGISQLKNSRLYSEIADRYPELTKEQLEKEVLATAIGMEGAKVFNSMQERSAWRNWLARFFDKLKGLLGIHPNVAKKLASQLLTNTIASDATHSLSSYVQMQKDKEPGVTEIEEEIEELNEFKKDIQEAIKTKLDHIRRRKPTANKKVVKENKEKLENLLELITKMDNISAVLTFAKKAKSDTKAMLASYKTMHKKSASANIGLIHDMQDYIKAYDLIPEILKEIEELELMGENENFPVAIDILKNTASVRRSVDTLYDRLTHKLMTKKLAKLSTKVEGQYREKYQREFDQKNKAFEGSDLKKKEARDVYTNKLVADNREEIDKAEEEYVGGLLKLAPNDVSYVEAMAMDQSGINDHILHLAVKLMAKADFDTMTDFNYIMEKELGVWDEFSKDSPNITGTDQKQLYDKLLEKDSKGRLTNHFVSEYKMAEFLSAKKKMYEEANKLSDVGGSRMLKSGKIHEWASPRTKFIADWFADNFKETPKGAKEVMEDKWKNPQWEVLKKDKEAFALSQMFARLSKESDSHLPASKRLGTKIPTMKKDSMEALKDSGFIDSVKTGFNDMFKKQSDDTSEGEQVPTAKQEQSATDLKSKIVEVFATESGEEKHLIPIAFRGELKDSERSYDLMGMMMSNLYMSQNFKHKSELQASVEMVKELVGNRKVASKSGNKSKKAKGTDKDITTSGLSSNAYKALNSAIEASLYGIQSVDSGNILGLNVNKMTALAVKYTADLSLIANIPSAAQNTLQGKMSQLIEGMSGEYYNGKNIKRGDAKYWGDIKALVSDVGIHDKRKNSKTNLLMKQFDMQGDFDGMRNSMVEDSRFKQMFSTDTLHGLNAIAENYIQGTLMYTLLDTIKVMDKDGKYITADGKSTDNIDDAMSLDEAYTVKDGKLILDPKVKSTTMERGSKDMSGDQLFEISRYMKEINARLNGGYDKKAVSNIKRTAVGKLMFSLRNWVPRAMERRFRGVSHVGTRTEDMDLNDRFFSEDTKDFREGYYTSSARLMVNAYKSFNEFKFKAMSVEYDKLNAHEKANIVRSAWEVGMSLSTLLLSIGLAALAEGDEGEEDDNQVLYFSAFMAARMYSELAYFRSPSELVKLMENPSIVLANFSKIMKALWQIHDPTAEITSGKFKGNNKFLQGMKGITPLAAQITKFDGTFDAQYNFTKK